MYMKHFLTMIIVALAALTATGQGNRLLMEDFTIEPDSTVTMPLILANTDSTRGLQFNMTPPQGLTIDNVKASRYSKKKGWSVSHYDQDGTTVVVIYKLGHITFPPDSMPVAVVEFVADSGFQGGELRIWKGRGATMDNASINIDGDTVSVTVPAASSINLEPAKEQYFNLTDEN